MPTAVGEIEFASRQMELEYQSAVTMLFTYETDAVGDLIIRGTEVQKNTKLS